MRWIIGEWRRIFHVAIDFFKIDVFHDFLQIFPLKVIQYGLKFRYITTTSTFYDCVRKLINKIDRELAEHLKSLETRQLLDFFNQLANSIGCCSKSYLDSPELDQFINQGWGCPQGLQGGDDRITLAWPIKPGIGFQRNTRSLVGIKG
ncbi:hypothetical protein D3C86_1562780 [compost metagenome]